MAGGKWQTQNKVRPGCYINFESVPRSMMQVGDRGIVAMAIPLDWGEEGDITAVTSEELYDARSVKKIGFSASVDLTGGAWQDNGKRMLVGALSYCYKALIYRLNKNCVKATVDSGNVRITARYGGDRGNQIKVSIENVAGIYTFITYLDEAEMDRQDAADFMELENNDYVTFEAVDTSDDTFGACETAGVDLTGGTNGDYEMDLPTIFTRLEKENWQCACFSSFGNNDLKAQKNLVQKWIRQMRDDKGRYVQCVVGDYDGANYEGIINVTTGAIIDGIEYDTETFTAIVAGMTAGAQANESNTAREITGATEIINEKDDVEAALKAGQFILTRFSDGAIKVEQDINSLHTFNIKKNTEFKKNRVLRVLDNIGTDTVYTWEHSYVGKVDNNDTGRAAFKGDLIDYGVKMQGINAMQDFDGKRDVSVEQGDELDTVVVNWLVKPVDSMEKLYMTVKVRS